MVFYVRYSAVSFTTSFDKYLFRKWLFMIWNEKQISTPTATSIIPSIANIFFLLLVLSFMIGRYMLSISSTRLLKYAPHVKWCLFSELLFKIEISSKYSTFNWMGKCLLNTEEKYKVFLVYSAWAIPSSLSWSGTQNFTFYILKCLL